MSLASLLVSLLVWSHLTSGVSSLHTHIIKTRNPSGKNQETGPPSVSGWASGVDGQQSPPVLHESSKASAVMYTTTTLHAEWLAGQPEPTCPYPWPLGFPMTLTAHLPTG